MQNKTSVKKIMGSSLAAAALAGASVAAAAPAANASGVWDQLAQCESGGDWSINTGNGYFGGLQFSQQSWEAVGGSGSPHQASKQEQIHRAEQLHAIQGWGAWPACSASLGLSGSPGASTPSDQGSGQASNQQAEQEAAQQAEQEAAQQAEQAPAPATDTQQNADVQVSGETRTVAAGDSLSKIANEIGLENWEDLWNANADQINDPNVIFVGQELQLPAF